MSIKLHMIHTYPELDFFFFVSEAHLLSMRFLQSNELRIMLLLSQRGVEADGPLQHVIHPTLRQQLYRQHLSSVSGAQSATSRNI